MMSPFHWLDSGRFVQRLEDLMNGDLSSNSALAQQASAVLDSVEASVAVVSCGMRKLCEEMIQDLLLPLSDEESCGGTHPSPPPNEADQVQQIHPKEEAETGVWGERGVSSTSVLEEGGQGDDRKGGAGAEEQVEERIETGRCVGEGEKAEEILPEIEGDLRSKMSRAPCLAASLMDGPEGQAYWYTSSGSRRKLRVGVEVVEEGWVVV